MVKGSKKMLEATNNGSMARVTGANKPKDIITTANVITDGTPFTTVGTDIGEGLFPGGSHVNMSLAASLNDIYPIGIPKISQNFDQYRVKNVEVFLTTGVTLYTSSVGKVSNLVVLSSIDLDDAIPITWEVFRTRKNISQNTVNEGRSTILLASFRPVANFVVSPGTSNPANMVPSKFQWFDVSASSQLFLGLKVHVACPDLAGTKFYIYAKVVLEFKAQI